MNEYIFGKERWRRIPSKQEGVWNENGRGQVKTMERQSKLGKLKRQIKGQRKAKRRQNGRNILRNVNGKKYE